MGLVSLGDKREVPGEPGQWIIVQGLNYDERRHAAKEAFRAAVSDMSDMADALAELERLQANKPTAAGERDEREPSRREFLNGFHWPTVLDAGLMDWSYPARTADGRPDWKQADQRVMEFSVATVLEQSGYDVPGGERPMGNSSAPSTGL